MNWLKIVRVLHALCCATTALMVAACVETPPPTEPTPEQAKAREQHRAKRMAEIAAYKRQIEDAKKAQLEKERAAAQKRENDEAAQRVQELVALHERDERIVARRRELERSQGALRRDEPAVNGDGSAVSPEQPDEAYLAYEWASKNCRFSQEDPHYVMHCDPICWRETVTQCPVFTCTAKPPTKGWVELANQRACSASRGTTNRRARAIGEHGFPPPQGPRQ